VLDGAAMEPLWGGTFVDPHKSSPELTKGTFLKVSTEETFGPLAPLYKFGRCGTTVALPKANEHDFRAGRPISTPRNIGA